jgi:hypothetical protein
VSSGIPPIVHFSFSSANMETKIYTKIGKMNYKRDLSRIPLDTLLGQCSHGCAIVQ